MSKNEVTPEPLPNRFPPPEKGSKERSLKSAAPEVNEFLESYYEKQGTEGPVVVQWAGQRARRIRRRRRADLRKRAREQFANRATIRDVPPLESEDAEEPSPWTVEMGGEGLPWRNGRLRIEKNPKLTPFRARGLGSDVGKYLDMFNSNPFAQEGLLRSVKTVVSAPWRLEKPVLPEYIEGEEREQAEFEMEQQWRWQQECWVSWRQPGQEYGWSSWVHDAALWPKVSGFYLGEIVFSLDDDGMPDLLKLPQFRAPWTVREWIFQGETWVGVLQTLSQFTDSGGATGKFQQAIPREKLIHIARVPKGPTDLEGTAALRSPWTYLKMLEMCYQLQALGIEVDALGTWTIEIDSKANVDRAAIEQLEQFLLNYRGENVPFARVPAGVTLKKSRPNDAMADLSGPIASLERAAMLGMGGAHLLMSLQGVGSNAARESGSADSRDEFDLEAQAIEEAAERLLRVGLEVRFPGHQRHYVAAVRSGHIETRDKTELAAVIEGLAKVGFMTYNTKTENWLREEIDAPLLEDPVEDEDGEPDDDIEEDIEGEDEDIEEEIGEDPEEDALEDDPPT